MIFFYNNNEQGCGEEKKVGDARKTFSKVLKNGGCAPPPPASRAVSRLN
jgi:hypothetical protein